MLTAVKCRRSAATLPELATACLTNTAATALTGIPVCVCARRLTVHFTRNAARTCADQIAQMRSLLRAACSAYSSHTVIVCRVQHGSIAVSRSSSFGPLLRFRRSRYGLRASRGSATASYCSSPARVSCERALKSSTG